MRLLPRLVPDWPKLAWVADMQAGTPAVHLLHGPMVELGQDWVVEAVWAGDVTAGDFDQTELVFGSGVRCRGEHVDFVSSGTTFDRLVHCRRGETWFVSNSLPALLAVAGLSLRDDYTQYPQDVQSIMAGLDNYARSLPVQDGQVQVTFYRNLRWDGRELHEVPKPETVPHFPHYAEYRQFLSDTAHRLGANMSDPSRVHRVVPLSGVSSGYDSSASAVIAREAGCKDTVTIRQSTSLWRGSDSGLPVAKALGMTCREYNRTARQYPLEEAIWAGTGRAGVLNWTLFEYPAPVCLFFTGWHGEKMWDRVDHDHPDPFVRRDAGPLGFCEFRLIRGVIQCPVPFWAAQRNGELKAITASPEMDPWKTQRDYDKPIARRILEEAGVPGTGFGQIKKNTSAETVVQWPHSPASAASFARYLRRHGLRSPPLPTVRFLRWASHIDLLLGENFLRKVGLDFRLRYRMRPPGSRLLFQWANSELKSLYEKGLRVAAT